METSNTIAHHYSRRTELIDSPHLVGFATLFDASTRISLRSYCPRGGSRPPAGCGWRSDAPGRVAKADSGTV